MVTALTTPMSPTEAMMCNPMFETGLYEWTHNCQRCVWAYELRRRGYNVVAKGKPKYKDKMAYTYAIARCIKGGKWIHVKDQKEITETAIEAGNSRWIIWTHNLHTRSAHVWILEYLDGKLLWIDPQLQGYIAPKPRFEQVRSKGIKILRCDEGELNWSYLERMVQPAEGGDGN